jgi:histone deacetylase 1/2
VFENLSRTLFAPSVQMQEVPRDQDMSEDEDEQDADDRFGRKKFILFCLFFLLLINDLLCIYIENLWDRRIVPDNEYYDSDEGEAQGPGGNVKSRHERNYNDDATVSKEATPMDAKMSQDEEAQIAEALDDDFKEEEVVEDDKIVTDTEDNGIEQEDIIMTGKTHMSDRI